MQEAHLEKHPHMRGRKVLDRIVLGGSDGVIESVAATAALNGANLDFSTIILAGFAFAIAGALSMFFSSYISEKSEIDTLMRDMERERMEIDTEPDEERRELEEILAREGYDRKEIDMILARLANDKELWLRTQLRLELQLHAGDIHEEPFERAIPAGVFFFIGAVLPLIPYFLPLIHSYALVFSLTSSVAVLFLLGSTKFISLKHVNVKMGIENAAIGGAAALLLYLIGGIIVSI